MLLVFDDGLVAKSAGDIRDALDGYFGVSIPVATLDAAIRGLTGRGFLVADPDRRLVVSDATRQHFQGEIAAAEEIERAVRDEWNSSHQALPEESRRLCWAALHRFMARAFLRHGAEATQLLSPELPPGTQLQTSYDRLLSEILQESKARIDQSLLEALIREFFTAATPLRTKYLAQLLDGTFTLFALSVDDATAAYLAGGFTRLDLFADTNFIFSLLGLNDDADVAVAIELVDSIHRLKVPFHLYYHPETLKEFRNTVQSIGDRLRMQRWQPSLSRAAWRSGAFTDLELKYFEQNAKERTDPDAFLTKYLRVDLLLKDRGFKPFREPDESEAEMMRRAELVASYKAYLEERHPTRVKPYPTMNHDIAVRLSIGRRRGRATSLLDAGAFMLTLDYIFYRFDWTVLRKKGEVGGTVLPHQLLQLLRPITEGVHDFDRRFVEGFTIPQLRAVRSFSSDTSIRILSYLNTLKDVKEETAIRILADDYLHQAVKTIDPSSPEFAQAVDSALARENAELRDALDQTQREVADIERRLTDEVSSRQDQIASRDREIAEMLSKLAETEGVLHDEQSEHAQAKTADQIERSQLRDQLKALQKQGTTMQWAVALLAVMLFAVVLFAGPSIIGQAWLGSQGWYRALEVGLLSMALAAVWVWLDAANRKYSVPLMFGTPLLVALAAVVQAFTAH